MIQESNVSHEKSSRYNLGLQAFQRIIELMDRVTIIGHKARKKFKDRTIIEYLGILETLFVKVETVLLDKDKEFIENELNKIKKEVDAYDNLVSGDRKELVERLTQLERRFYNAIQNINMYIQLKSDYRRHSKKMEFKDHLEGSSIPDFDDDEEDF